MEIKDRLQRVFIRVFDDDSIKIFDEMQGKDLEDWDSVMHIQLIAAIEREFQLEFTVGEIANLENVGEMINLLTKKTLK